MVATVNLTTGQIRGVNPGTTTITSASGQRATIRVTVDNTWHSDRNRVFFWNLRTINIRSEARSGITLAAFNDHIRDAQTQ